MKVLLQCGHWKLPYTHTHNITPDYVNPEQHQRLFWIQILINHGTSIYIVAQDILGRCEGKKSLLKIKIFTPEQDQIAFFFSHVRFVFCATI